VKVLSSGPCASALFIIMQEVLVPSRRRLPRSPHHSFTRYRPPSAHLRINQSSPSRVSAITWLPGIHLYSCEPAWPCRGLHSSRSVSPPSSPAKIKLTHQCRLGLSHAYVHLHHHSHFPLVFTDTLRTAYPQPLLQSRRPYSIPQDQPSTAKRTTERAGKYVARNCTGCTMAAADAFAGTGPSAFDHFTDEVKSQLKELTWQKKPPKR
jgi:hypothetical protein